MSFISMTSTSSSSSSLLLPHDDHERLDLNSIEALVSLINQHIGDFLVDNLARKRVKQKCSSKLKTRKQEFFEFSEQSIISNLYWGVESIEAALQAKQTEEKITRLKNAEKMLQVPALLNEHGATAEIPNCFLVCCSYFYLSLVRELQRDKWQVSIHFLQALLVSPMLVYKEFAPKLCTSLFELCILSQKPELKFRNFEEGEISEALRWIARKYKGRLMYYQIMSYGEAPHGCRDVALADENKAECLLNTKYETKSSDRIQREHSLQAYNSFEKVHPIDLQENIIAASAKEPKFISIPHLLDHSKAIASLNKFIAGDTTKISNIRRLQDVLKEPESNTSISSEICDIDFVEEDDLRESADASVTSLGFVQVNADQQQEVSDENQQASSSLSDPIGDVHICKETTEEDRTKFDIGTFSGSIRELNSSQLKLGVIESHTTRNYQIEEETSHRGVQPQDFKQFDHIEYKVLQDYHNFQESIRGNPEGAKHSSSHKNIGEICLHPGENGHVEQVGVLEKIISKLCFSEEIGEEDYTVEITTVYEMLNNRTGVKYSLLKNIILDQLLTAISTSKEDGVIRTSVSILSTIISVNKSVIEEIKKKGLRLSDLATALKRNVYEAATIIYLVKPSPAEIKSLELLPLLIEVICTSSSQKCGLKPPKLTPPAASLMMIEVLVTAFDYATNNMHLEAISSPRVLDGLLNAPKQDNLEEVISLAAILVKCMRFDGQCRKQISQSTPVAPFVALLVSNQKPAILAGLEFFNEILRMPRQSAINLLQQIQEQGRINDIRALLLHILQSQPDYKLLAANLLIQLDIMEDSSSTTVYVEESMEVLLESMILEENPASQKISAFILSNLGGTYAWTGEPYTVAWLARKAGLTSLHHKNMIRNIAWSDQSLQDSSTDTWCNKIARRIMKLGIPLFHALEKGLKRRSKRISRECLTTIAWLGCEIVKSPDDLRYSACEILLSTIEQYVHPGLELEERLLACLCIYNYASGRAMQKLVNFSEGVRESLRRLSSITWMAEELLKVADYLQPNKWRISCVHTQILEVGESFSGAVNALIYYKGELYGGYSDGSIKAWDVKRQSGTLIRNMKEHRKAVTCFSLFEPGDCLLSGSADKTIRVWQMVNQKLECIEVIPTKRSIQSIDTSGNMIFVVTQNNKMKVFDASEKHKHIYKKKNVKCIKVKEGKFYLGCQDSSIQEVVLTNNREQVMKPPSWNWRMQRKPTNSIALYKDWLYSASSVVEGSSIKEWKRHSKPQMSIVPDKNTTVLAMEVVEDFIYLQCSSSMNCLQIWLRGAQHKVGRLSAGSKITSLLTANDMVLCGTETGLIKGWIPL